MRLEAFIEADNDRNLHGFNHLLGQYARTAFLLFALINLAGLADRSFSPAMRGAQVGVAAAALAAFWWSRNRVPSLAVRTALGVGVVIWATIRAVELSRTGWPLTLEGIPVAAVFLALAVHWWMALALVLIVGGAVGVTYATGTSPVPPFLLQFAGNWLVCAGGLLYLVRQLLRAFDEGATDLIASANSLEASQREATVLAAKLTLNVRKSLDALAARLTDGVGNMSEAVQDVLTTLKESRRQIPPEPELGSTLWQDRLLDIRTKLAQTLVWAGSTVLLLQVLRTWWAGLTDIAQLIALQLGLLMGLVLFHGRRPRVLRWTVHLAAGVSALTYILNVPNWERLGVGSGVLPPLSITLVLLIVLGVVSAERWVVMIWPAVLATGTLVLQGRQAWPSVIVCVVYATLGVMLSSLQQAMLLAITTRRQEAMASIVRRRRLIGTLFHDLANPLQALAMLLEPEEGGDSTPDASAPSDAMPLVHRMRATLDAALGQVQPPEQLPLSELVDALLSVFGARLAAKRIELVPVWDPNVSVQANRSILQDTVLANLLSNAIKFSPSGGTIGIRGARRGGEVCLEIQDQGPGLPAAVRAAVEAGRVAPSAVGTSGEQGSGHGLLLTRDYLLEMGGTLTFEQPSDGGLIARVVLPAA